MKFTGQELNDTARLADLEETGLLQVLGDEVFRRYARLASEMMKVEVSLVSLVSDQCQHFVSEVGLPPVVSEQGRTPLSHSFCQHVVTSGAPLVIESAREDIRVKDNPAIDDLGIEAYMGVPIISEEGNVLGSFCVIDHHSRKWDSKEISFMEDLRSAVCAEIELRRKSRRMERTIEELRLANRRNDELVHMIVHDLRNPLSGIKGGLDLLRMSEGKSEEEEEILSIFDESCSIMNDLIEQILETNKIQASSKHLTLESIELEPFYQELQRQTELFARSRSIRTQWKTEDGPERWLVDRRVLFRMLQNLLINAIKFTPKGGEVIFSANSLHDAEGICLSVADDGPGVSLEERGAIFGKFAVGKASTSKSFGLGLNFCQMVAQAHGGSIRIDDRLKKGGSIFSVILPLIKR